MSLVLSLVHLPALFLSGALCSEPNQLNRVIRSVCLSVVLHDSWHDWLYWLKPIHSIRRLLGVVNDDVLNSLLAIESTDGTRRKAHEANFEWYADGDSIFHFNLVRILRWHRHIRRKGRNLDISFSIDDDDVVVRSMQPQHNITGDSSAPTQILGYSYSYLEQTSGNSSPAANEEQQIRPLWSTFLRIVGDGSTRSIHSSIDPRRVYFVFWKVYIHTPTRRNSWVKNDRTSTAWQTKSFHSKVALWVYIQHTNYKHNWHYESYAATTTRLYWRQSAKQFDCETRRWRWRSRLLHQHHKQWGYATQKTRIINSILVVIDETKKSSTTNRRY